MVGQKYNRGVLRNTEGGKEIEGLVHEYPRVESISLLEVSEKPSLGSLWHVEHNPPRYVPRPEPCQAHVQLHHPTCYLEGNQIRSTTSPIFPHNAVSTKFVGRPKPCFLFVVDLRKRGSYKPQIRRCCSFGLFVSVYQLILLSVG